MKNKLITLFFLITSISGNSQFYSELGIGYAFSKQNKKFIFNGYGDFKIIGNLFTGHFYDLSVGYIFKNKIGIEINGEFNPRSSKIYNEPKSIVNKYYDLNLYDGSFLSVIPRITYQYQLKQFNFLLGWGLGYNLLNHYSYLRSSYVYREYNTQHELVYSEIERKEILYRYQEEHYIMNIDFKINYTFHSNISIFVSVNTNFNSNFFVIHPTVKSKIHQKIYIEQYNINSNPNLTIINIDEEKRTSRQIQYTYYDIFNVYNAKSLFDLVYPQIGIRYTFTKKEASKKLN